MKLLEKIDNLIIEDPIWEKVCLMDSETNRTCAFDPDPDVPKISRAHPLFLFKLVYGEDCVEDLTQFAIDFAMFGVS